jgi:hypothetical protein
MDATVITLNTSGAGLDAGSASGAVASSLSPGWPAAATSGVVAPSGQADTAAMGMDMRHKLPVESVSSPQASEGKCKQKVAASSPGVRDLSAPAVPSVAELTAAEAVVAVEAVPVEPSSVTPVGVVKAIAAHELAGESIQV